MPISKKHPKTIYTSLGEKVFNSFIFGFVLTNFRREFVTEDSLSPFRAAVTKYQMLGAYKQHIYSSQFWRPKARVPARPGPGEGRLRGAGSHRLAVSSQGRRQELQKKQKWRFLGGGGGVQKKKATVLLKCVLAHICILNANSPKFWNFAIKNK